MRILLVEDDEALCAAVAPLLEQEGYRVDVCRDGDDALYYCPHTRFAGAARRADDRRHGPVLRPLSPSPIRL